MRAYDLARYGIWCGVAATSAANRREYGMTTTWLPHLATNSVSLLLPDLYRAMRALGQNPAVAARLKQLPIDQHIAQLCAKTLDAMILDNPRYVLYVLPLAAGYLLSSPWLNIYKGRLGELKFAGLGLDALPHSATAFALTCLIRDTLSEAAEHTHVQGQFDQALRWLDTHHTAFSGSVLALVTGLWESGEYAIHVQELAQRGSAEAINMQWSVEDTLGDCASNAIGWALAAASEHRASLFARVRGAFASA